MIRKLRRIAKTRDVKQDPFTTDNARNRMMLSSNGDSSDFNQTQSEQNIPAPRGSAVPYDARVLRTSMVLEAPQEALRSKITATCRVEDSAILIRAGIVKEMNWLPCVVVILSYSARYSLVVNGCADILFVAIPVASKIRRMTRVQTTKYRYKLPWYVVLTLTVLVLFVVNLPYWLCDTTDNLFIYFYPQADGGNKA